MIAAPFLQCTIGETPSNQPVQRKGKRLFCHAWRSSEADLSIHLFGSQALPPIEHLSASSHLVRRIVTRATLREQLGLLHSDGSQLAPSGRLNLVILVTLAHPSRWGEAWLKKAGGTGMSRNAKFCLAGPGGSVQALLMTLDWLVDLFFWTGRWRDVASWALHLL